MVVNYRKRICRILWLLRVCITKAESWRNLMKNAFSSDFSDFCMDFCNVSSYFFFFLTLASSIFCPSLP